MGTGATVEIGIRELAHRSNDGIDVRLLWSSRTNRLFVGVRPDCRGSGLGRALYEHFFETVRAENRSVVRCVTSPVNEGSIAFHARMGFRHELVVGYDGADRDRVVFEKRL